MLGDLDSGDFAFQEGVPEVHGRKMMHVLHCGFKTGGTRIIPAIWSGALAKNCSRLSGCAGTSSRHLFAAIPFKTVLQGLVFSVFTSPSSLTYSRTRFRLWRISSPSSGSHSIRLSFFKCSSV